MARSASLSASSFNKGMAGLNAQMTQLVLGMQARVTGDEQSVAAIRSVERAVNRLSGRLARTKTVTQQAVAPTNRFVVGLLKLRAAAFSSGDGLRWLWHSFARLLVVMAAFAAARKAIGLGPEIMRATSNMEDFNVVLASMLGSWEKGQAYAMAITREAAKTPFTVQQLQQGTRIALGQDIDLLKDYNVLLKNGQKHTMNMAAAVGQWAYVFRQGDFERTTLAVSRYIGNATWNTKQMGFAGEKFLAIAQKVSREMGVQLNLSTKAGREQAFAMVSAERTGDMMDQMKNTWSIIISNIKDFMYIFKVFIGWGGFFDKVKETFKSIQDFFQNNMKLFEQFGHMIGQFLGQQWMSFHNIVSKSIEKVKAFMDTAVAGAQNTLYPLMVIVELIRHKLWKLFGPEGALGGITDALKHMVWVADKLSGVIETIFGSDAASKVNRMFYYILTWSLGFALAILPLRILVGLLTFIFNKTLFGWLTKTAIPAFVAGFKALAVILGVSVGMLGIILIGIIALFLFFLRFRDNWDLLKLAVMDFADIFKVAFLKVMIFIVDKFMWMYDKIKRPFNWASKKLGFGDIFPEKPPTGVWLDEMREELSLLERGYTTASRKFSPKRYSELMTFKSLPFGERMGHMLGFGPRIGTPDDTGSHGWHPYGHDISNLPNIEKVFTGGAPYILKGDYSPAINQRRMFASMFGDVAINIDAEAIKYLISSGVAPEDALGEAFYKHTMDHYSRQMEKDAQLKGVRSLEAEKRTVSKTVVRGKDYGVPPAAVGVEIPAYFRKAGN